jgi:hypothetical protein
MVITMVFTMVGRMGLREVHLSNLALTAVLRRSPVLAVV